MASNSRFPLLCFITFSLLCWLDSLLRRASDDSNSTERKQLSDSDDIERSLRVDKANDTTPKRRALLIGISYKHIPSNEQSVWEPLDGAHADIERFRELLIKTYGYSPEDIVILKDDPNLPDLFQPTRVNMLHELRRLVSGAAPGDKFTFLYSGHSDWQYASSDYYQDEDDDKDEQIVTGDLQRIISDDLHDILVGGLPVDCTLLAILDTCHSSTMLDLPHHRCNNVYVPWLSKDERRTRSYDSVIVRGNAFDFVGFSDEAFRRPTSFVDITTSQWLNDAPSGAPIGIITDIDSISSTDQRETSPEANQQKAPNRGRPRRCSSPILFPSRCASPVGIMCYGWCGYGFKSPATVLSLSARADPQHAWEGPRASLTAVLCRFLEVHPNPSFRTLMSHVNFQLYEDHRVLHEYFLAQKRKALQGEGYSFDREHNYFQTPQLSSLSKVEMSDILRL